MDTSVHNIKEESAAAYTITIIDGGKVTIKCNLKECNKDAEYFLRGKFAVYDVVKDAVDNFDARTPTKLMGWNWSAEEGNIRLALDGLYGKHATYLKNLTRVVPPMQHRALQADDASLGSVCLKTHKDPVKETAHNVALNPLLKTKKGTQTSTGIGGLKEPTPRAAAPPGWPQRARAGATVNAALKHASTSMGVKVPVLANSENLAAGDTLHASREMMATLSGKPVRVATGSGPKKKAMPPPCRVTNTLAIEGGGLKEPRVPRDILLRGGTPWIELSEKGAQLQLFAGPPA
ncbi:unnamed protein product [Prorocentrum cordatum]|uniref:Uncharacterized protein n=1 Tax=Prorocentrum cordatum TaxID=2364126 RepID=A0ABN9QGD5_9DINO|nr:unnamed protein product [Polarella glacialis]